MMKPHGRKRPPRIILFGTWAEENLGDDLLLLTEIRELRREWPDAELILFTGRPDITRRLLQSEGVDMARITLHYTGRWGLKEPGSAFLGSLGWLFRELLLLWRADLLLFGPGNQIQDVTRKHRVLFFLLRCLAAWLMRTPFAIIGISFYSLTNKMDRRILRFLANRAAFVSTRDAASADDFRALGVRPDNVHAGGDISFCYPWPAPPPPQEQAVPVIGLTNRVFLTEIFPDDVSARLNRSLAELLVHIHTETGAAFRFFPFYRGSRWHDGVARDRILSHIDDPAFPLETVPIRNLEATRQEMARCHAFIGVRYHSVLISAQAAVPVLAIGYGKKTCRFMTEYGLSDACLPVERVTPDALTAAWDRLWQDRDAWRSRLSDANARAAANARVHFDLIRETLEGK